jgi:hypothetical protein
MHTIRSRQHDLCGSCGRYSYSTRDNYCMGCGWSDRSIILETLQALRFVLIGICVLAAVGWLMS